MDYAEKLALATRVADLTVRPFAKSLPADRPPPPAAMLARIEEMTDRRRALMAKLYAERLSEEQLLVLEAHHNSEVARSIAAEMPRIVAEVQKQFTELWGSGESRHNVAFDAQSGSKVAAIVRAGPPLGEQQQAAVKHLLDEERLVETTHAQLIRNYLQTVEAGATGAALSRFYTPEAEQIEQPNRLNPIGGRSDLATLLARAEKGKQLLSAQRYDVVSLVAEGHHVATEVLWTGTLAVPLGSLAAGAEMRAHIAMFFEMKNGLIHRQRNYDCFEAW